MPDDRIAKRLTLMDVVDRVPPSGMHLLVILAPVVHALHGFVVLATWQRGAVASWLLLIAYTLICLYGYDVLRYAPQALPLAWIAYTWITSTVARASGTQSARGATSRSISRTLAELDDLADFCAALRDEVLTPLGAVLSWRSTVPSTAAVATFLVVSWPFWFMCVLPRSMWLLPIYSVETTAARVWASAPVAAARGVARECAHALGAALLAQASMHAPRVTQALLTAAAHIRAGAASALATMHVCNTRLTLQLVPPFPIASLELRHVLLFTGLLALTWCAPWAKLVRRALWHSALVRHVVLTALRILSGSDTLVLAWRTSRPARHVHAQTPQAPAKALEYETVFEFAIFENQRWWIGLDWTAALLPNERPSWSDADNNPVAPPAAFTLPRAKCTYVPSERAGLVDRRKSEWVWIDPEWTVDGAQFITSTAYTPHDASADEKRVHETSEAALGAVTDAADRHKAEALALSGADVPGLVREPAPAPRAVDPEGWEYGDNSWDKLSKIRSMGCYTRRRRWVRRAVLAQTVEKGIKRSD